jgi:hypothetical protein
VAQGGLLRRRVRERLDELAQPETEPPHDGVREFDGALEARGSHELHGLVHRCVRRDLGKCELVRAQPKRRANRWVELRDRPLAELLDPMVERADALDGPVRQALRQRPVPRVETLRGAAKGPVGVGGVLEHPYDRVERRLSGRGHAHLRPRRNSS